MNGYQFIIALVPILIAAFFSWRASVKGDQAKLKAAEAAEKARCAEGKASEAAEVGRKSLVQAIQNGKQMDGRLSELIRTLGLEQFQKGIEDGKAQQKVISDDLDAARKEQPPTPPIPDVELPKE